MQKLIPTMVVLSFIVAPAATAQECYPAFTDSALRSAVAACSGAPPFYPLDGTTMLNMISLTGGGISNLSGLQCAANLQDMMLTNGWISDLTPIGGLEQLYWVDLTANEVADIAPLGGLPSLEILVLSDNWITDVSPLASAPALWWLHLQNNSIQDISSLASLTGLTKLYLNGNPLDRAAYDTYLGQIETNNPGIDLRYDPYIPRGDADMDGDVDLDDFAALKSGFAGPGGWHSGDFDGSGMVDLNDFVTLKQNSGGTTVPEPTSAMLLGVALAACVARRRAKGGNNDE